MIKKQIFYKKIFLKLNQTLQLLSFRKFNGNFLLHSSGIGWSNTSAHVIIKWINIISED